MNIDPSVMHFTKKEKRKFFKEQGKEKKLADRKRIRIIQWASIIVVTVLIFLGGKSAVSALSKPLPGKSVPILGRTHVPVGTKVTYNSNPPTSGDHYATPEPAGVYDTPIPDGNLIHSLEHGYVIISYNCNLGNSQKTCLSFVGKLAERVNSDSWKLILIPRLVLDANFALTAWGRIDKFNTASATLDRVNAFINAFRGDGPEKTAD